MGDGQCRVVPTEFLNDFSSGVDPGTLFMVFDSQARDVKPVRDRLERWVSLQETIHTRRTYTYLGNETYTDIRISSKELIKKKNRKYQAEMVTVLVLHRTRMASIARS